MVERPWEPLIFPLAVAARSDRPSGRGNLEDVGNLTWLHLHDASLPVTEIHGRSACCAGFHSLNAASSSRCSSSRSFRDRCFSVRTTAPCSFSMQC